MQLDWQFVLSHLIQFGTLLALLLAILELLKYPQHNYALFWLLLSLASLQARYGLYLIGAFESYPLATFGFVSSLFVTGPLLWLFLRRLLFFAFEKEDQRIWPHFVTGAAAFIFEVVFFFITSPEQLSQMTRQLHSYHSSALNLFMGLGTVSFLVYLFYSFTMFLRVRARYSLQYPRSLLAIIIIPLPTMLCTTLGFRLQIMPLYGVGISLITLILLLVFILKERNPQVFAHMRIEVEKRKYAKTQLSGVNVAEIKQKLLDLMQNHELFLEEDLRLATVAQKLAINSNQLSRILNEQFSQNFYEFVNSYRIERAKQKLISERDKDILTIAYEVGFNNKVTFNNQFAKLVGQTPSKFRKSAV